MKTSKLLLLSGMFASLGMLASCADDDLANGGGKNDGDKGTAVTFNVSDAQDDATAAQPAQATTRAAFAQTLAPQGLTPEDLTSQKLPVSGADNVCLIETTTAGMPPLPVQETDAPQTRANITTTKNLPNFSTIGFRGTSSGNATTPWFHNKDTNPDGTLVKPIQWSWGQPYGKFFAVAVASTTNPNAKPTLSPEGTAAPYVDFEVKRNVADQEDLMTACSGEVHYAKQGIAPQINLKFRHALTAVRFKVGQNLSWNKTITKVEILGAKSEGRYMLPTDETGTGAKWTNLSKRKLFILRNLNVSTSEAVNNIIVGKPGDNYTFYMIPQFLLGDVKVRITLNDGKELTTYLRGIWKPGTTKTYTLTENTSTWEYQLTVSSPRAAAHTDTDAGAYTVQSYREDPVTHTQQPVAWKVVSYQESTDGGMNFGAPTTDKPAWLTALSMESGNGGIVAETGKVTLRKDITDKLAEYNKVLQNAKPKGSAADPYDLSTHNFKGEYTPQNTANSYLISAPGWYKIPLVYGNAIEDSRLNEHSYKREKKGYKVLSRFVDHIGFPIKNPFINKNHEEDPATQASIVWTDQSGIVDGLSVTGKGYTSYLNFHVPADKIKNGNAVIAVKNKAGVIMWSWHLWFDHSDALNTIACTNYQRYTYKFTKKPLGFACHEWNKSTYDKARIARVRVEQTIANGGTKQYANIYITQNPGIVKEISSTLYQFGRKDAFPGTDNIADGSFNQNGGDEISVKNCIQHPETFYTFPLNCDSKQKRYIFHNLWSMEAYDVEVYDYNNDYPVVKTIYDPCPAGFHIPAPNAFTGFTNDGQESKQNDIRGFWNRGWVLNSNSSSRYSTIYFPTLNSRYYFSGFLARTRSSAMYWVADSSIESYGRCMFFSDEKMYPCTYTCLASGLSVRPVSE